MSALLVPKQHNAAVTEMECSMLREEPGGHAHLVATGSEAPQLHEWLKTCSKAVLQTGRTGKAATAEAAVTANALSATAMANAVSRAAKAIAPSSAAMATVLLSSMSSVASRPSSRPKLVSQPMMGSWRALAKDFGNVAELRRMALQPDTQTLFLCYHMAFVQTCSPQSVAVCRMPEMKQAFVVSAHDRLSGPELLHHNHLQLSRQARETLS